MLIIGHRGAAGLAPENTIESLRAGVKAGVDMLEFDIRLTKDKVPVLLHNRKTAKSGALPSLAVSRYTLHQLQKQLGDKAPVTLEVVLDQFFGKILLNIEIKTMGAGKKVLKLLKSRYITTDKDWDYIIFSSFLPSELVAIRKQNTLVGLALLHSINPFVFLVYKKTLNLSAVGFHRLYLPEIALEIAKKAKLFTYVYTVDRPKAAHLIARRGIDGIVTNRPDTILKEIRKHAK